MTISVKEIRAEKTQKVDSTEMAVLLKENILTVDKRSIVSECDAFL